MKEREISNQLREERRTFSTIVFFVLLIALEYIEGLKSILNIPHLTQ